MTQSNFVTQPAITNNGYYQLVADNGGAGLHLCSAGGGAVTCQPGGIPGRQGKWLLSEAGNGYYYIRTAAPITSLATSTKLTNLDFTGGNPALSLYMKDSPEQMWAIENQGTHFVIRPAKDSYVRLRANNGAAPSTETDTTVVPVSAKWTLVPTDAL